MLPTIAVIDSGIGGLSILAAIQQLIPARIIYCADRQFFPYGTKEQQQITTRLLGLRDRLSGRHPIDAFVIACNTASTVSLAALRQDFATPIVGVVPAVKPAAAASQTKVIGILATERTIQQPYTQQLIAQFAADCRVLAIGSRWLVEIAENKLMNPGSEQPDANRLQQELAIFIQDKQLDTVVLACTHFPFLRPELQRLLGEGVRLIEPSLGVATHLKNLLGQVRGARSVPLAADIYYSTLNADAGVPVCFGEGEASRFVFEHLPF